LGNRTVITDARQHVTTYSFDQLSRLIAMTDPLTHTTASVRCRGQPH
jgi:YD repeat-containing protein